jgi:hypothetical protein
MSLATLAFAEDPGVKAPASEAVSPSETASVATLPPPGDHWIFVPDRLLHHSLIFDGDSGEMLGIVDTPTELMFPRR